MKRFLFSTILAGGVAVSGAAFAQFGSSSGSFGNYGASSYGGRSGGGQTYVPNATGGYEIFNGNSGNPSGSIVRTPLGGYEVYHYGPQGQVYGPGMN